MKLSKNLIEQAIKGSAMSGLSISEQIEHWANIGSVVEVTSTHKSVSSELENRAVWLNYKMTLQTSLVGDPPAMNAV